MNKPAMYLVPTPEEHLIENSSSRQHNPQYRDMGDGNGGGGNMLEARVAKLEADVDNIKTTMMETRADIRDLTKNSASTKTDVSTILQKIVDIDEKLSNKAGKDFVDVKVGGLKIWMLGILLLSIAMPVISFLLNLYLKKS